jgi:hypothetical protein
VWFGCREAISIIWVIRVIANANIASLKDMTCSNFIDGANDPEAMFEI